MHLTTNSKIVTNTSNNLSITVKLHYLNISCVFDTRYRRTSLSLYFQQYKIESNKLVITFP